MKTHTKSLTTPLALVLHSGGETLQTDLQARMHVAALARLGFDRCAPPLIARPYPDGSPRLDRSLRTVWGWGEPGMVGGLRAHDLLLCPRPFARVVVRGLAAAVDAPPSLAEGEKDGAL